MFAACTAFLYLCVSFPTVVFLGLCTQRTTRREFALRVPLCRGVRCCTPSFHRGTRGLRVCGGATLTVCIHVGVPCLVAPCHHVCSQYCLVLFSTLDHTSVRKAGRRRRTTKTVLAMLCCMCVASLDASHCVIPLRTTFAALVACFPLLIPHARVSMVSIGGRAAVSTVCPRCMLFQHARAPSPPLFVYRRFFGCVALSVPAGQCLNALCLGWPPSTCHPRPHETTGLDP